MGRYVVYDCDVGNDDAWGLMMLIKAEEAYKRRQELTASPKKFEIIGVTCVQGNTTVEHAVENTLRVLDVVNRNDIPVYKGCSNLFKPRPWENPKYFVGKDGFGDLEHEKPVDLSLVRPEHAVNAMYEFVCKHPKQVDFLLVGPLTNFAMCISMYGTKFLDKVGEIYIMGGNYRGKGNTTKSAEFNFMMDPEAAQIVFENVEAPVTILPWETCDDQAFRITLDWRLNILGTVESPFVRLLNRVERALLVPRGVKRWLVCDALAVAVYLFPHLVVLEQQLHHAAVELAGIHTRGQMVIDHLRREQANANIITKINIDHYQKIIAWTGGLRGVHMECELGKEK
ncbi:inosine-uridine preferring nucleoside hydrolase-like [Bactrocera neohumeralis]|uniref:inosine-uridine preferring nucleoside hydrolase-like n=1 Tax=Bactrocera neohumeralis TaxID=98809 RepID=UPI0021654403|nr:inosine-uridine preferring nucleoside hydrolase-like [Bactrocera neohumeralis]